MTYRIKTITACIVIALLIWAGVVYGVYAQGATQSVVTQSMMPLIIENILPIVGALLTAILTAVLAKVYAYLGVQDSATKLDIEAKLREALHSAAMNGISYGLSKLGITYVRTLTDANAVVDYAAQYVESKNPETLAKLKVSSRDLNDIVRTKLGGISVMDDGRNGASTAKPD